MLTAGPALRLLPPLTITKGEMDQGLAILDRGLKNDPGVRPPFLYEVTRDERPAEAAGSVRVRRFVKILDVADQMKYNQKHGLPHDKLKGKTLAMIFEKNSTRTRVSFETGMYPAGGPRPVPLRQGEPDRPGRAGGGHRPGAPAATATAS